MHLYQVTFHFDCLRHEVAWEQVHHYECQLVVRLQLNSNPLLKTIKTYNWDTSVNFALNEERLSNKRFLSEQDQCKVCTKINRLQSL